MRADGTFIAVEVDDQAAADSALAVKLSDACPVDIFAKTESGVSIVEKNLDECVLCGLCLAAAPEGAVTIIKLYDNDAVLTSA
ncbi:MAG TPA: ferredoxin family protein [Solirubrobacteraceae bacterium]|jgi:NAD-dependent dihydropyrimidine dehydrogenase PreA subunit|nr:ferredoxin family protein [Solirubrobacteraceae bacterium]